MAAENNNPEWGFGTKAVHAGQRPDPVTGAVTVPVYQTSTYQQDAVGEDRGYEYSRTGNPTLSVGIKCCSSRRSRIWSGICQRNGSRRHYSAPTYTGDHVIMGNDAYGGTFRLISKVFTRFGISYSSANLSDPDEVKAAFTDKTKMVWAETPTNPLLSVVDIGLLATLSHDKNALLVVDNTFATPYLQKPLSLGADIVIHSATRYLGGHSDVVGGFAATNSSEIDQELAFLQNAVGAVPAPWDCYLLLRGIKTLGVRMDRHCDNAEKVVEFLLSHSKVKEVLYPGLDTHPTFSIAEKQMERYGGMVSFTVNGGEEEARDIAQATKIFTLAESLGAVESLIEIPAAMTHLSTEGSPLEVDKSLIRLSVGIETITDLIGDLDQAMS